MMQSLDFLTSMVPQHGDEIALEDDQSAVSYAELTVAVNAMAVALQSKDPTPGSRVGLCAAHSLEYLVSVLAILASIFFMVVYGAVIDSILNGECAQYLQANDEAGFQRCIEQEWGVSTMDQ